MSGLGNNSPDLEVACMTPEARRVYEEEFLPRYRKLLESVEKTPLVILVWGPGVSGGSLYGKRVQILNTLRACGHTALFSEQIDADCPMEYASAKARELLHAKAADFIVVIQGSPGSIAEVGDFAGFVRDIGSKMLIFVDERVREGYSYKGALQELRTLYSNVETYKYPEDIRECHLTHKVLEKAKVLQVAKWRRENLG